MAINGGFFREIANNLYVPAGALKINNLWQGIAYHPRGAIGWKSNTDLVLIDRLKTKTTIKIGPVILPISYFNPSYDVHNNYNVIIYSSIYPNFSNLNKLDHKNLFIKQQDNYPYIFNIHHKLAFHDFSTEELEATKINVEVFPQIDSESKKLWEDLDFITSGAPILIKNHQLLSDYITENLSNYFINTKHPRTAICITDDPLWKFIQTQELTIPQLANIMQLLNCKDAINLDGGSSSDLYLSKQLSQQQTLHHIGTPVTDAIMVLDH